MSLENGPTKHIALVGVTGVGKSTLVNVLSGSNCAKVTNDVNPCTVRPGRYDIEQGGIRYSLWDTRGLNEAREQEATGPIARFLKFLRMRPDEDRELRKFLSGKDPKISLILFCIDAKKMRVDAQWKNYDKIYVKFCARRIRVAVVVTRMDRNTRDTTDGWRTMCKDMVRKAVGEEVPEAGMVEAVPTFERPEDDSLVTSPEDARDCKNRILGLISNFC